MGVPSLELMIVLLFLGNGHGNNHPELLQLLVLVVLPEPDSSQRCFVEFFRVDFGFALLRVDVLLKLGVLLHHLLFGDLLARWLVVGLGAR
jgi:hypothetical protein